MKKTISFAIIHMGVAFTVGYAMSGDIWVGGALALVEPLCNTVAFYFHEKIWNRKAENSTGVDTVTTAETSAPPAIPA
ncbi:DUF2061 domain-containing protein [Ketobacter sp. MCCC 1A13808]|uniref:DUF2061 domain-containing protein n=1 Tax=Ketobacter sp. MCCC 1A13808 TaxID=2602738 RepID=UPI000F142739|nr:DUF2061 domain-containing protein [Ketobacter sp. MCCC 1A13808]MVF11849.1 DUF2061 domain-containing protein [Ketobacter sp. MCCC 1A13808]RLP55450.1 MAG: DUF2061 domain-containing protein [Ketobacter sp.]